MRPLILKNGYMLQEKSAPDAGVRRITVLHSPDLKFAFSHSLSLVPQFYSLMADDPPTGSPPSFLLAIPALDNTLGAVFLGTALASMLCGLGIHQTYRYFRNYSADVRLLKIMVGAICVLDAAHEAMAIHLCYFYMVSHYLDPLRLLSGVWSLRLIVTVTGAIGTITHLVFARRVFILSGRQKMYPLVAIVMIIGEMAFAIAATVITFVDVTFARFEEHSVWVVYTALSLRVATDIGLALSLIFYLQRSRTGFKSTDSMIDKLILYAFNTGLVTSVFSLATVIAAVTLPGNLIYIGIYIVSSKMYSSSVLAVLNSRKSLGKMKSGINSTGTSWLEMQIDVPPTSSATRTRMDPREAIELGVKASGPEGNADHFVFTSTTGGSAMKE